MRIALLNSVCYGSTGKIARGIASHVRAAGGEARVYYGRGSSFGDTDAVRIESNAEVYAHLACARLSDRQGFYSKMATKRLIRALAAFDPDVVHLHNLHGYWLDMETLFPFLAAFQKPVVWTLHDCWPFTGHCAYFDAANCMRWQTGCYACPKRSEYPQSLLLDRSARNYMDKKRLFTAVPNMTFVTPSQWLAERVGDSFLRAYPACVLPNGIDLTVFRPTESALRERYGLVGKRLLLGVAQVWEPRKGMDMLLQLRKRLPTEYAMALIGLNGEQMEQLPAGVLGLPRTKDAAELAAWYTAADVLVDCTCEENFPTTHLEALACGTPVATFAAGGSAEMLTETCGVGVPVGDLEALRLAVDQATTLRGADCLAQARRYDTNERLAAYLPLYEELLGKAGAKSMGEKRI